MQIENVSLIEVIAAARGRHASLVPESTGYLMLGTVRAMGGRPVDVDPRRVTLSTEGQVALTGPRQSVASAEVAKSLHQILRVLLEVSQGVGTALRTIAAGEPPPLEALFIGVTKSLIPINRSAAKRALGRLARETVRARNRGLIAPEDLEWSPRSEDEPAAVESSRAPVEAAPSSRPVGAPAEAVVPVVVEQAPVASEPDLAEHPRSPLPLEPVAFDVAETWEEIDAEFELATPIPAMVNIELATPTPAPVLLVSPAAESPVEVDASSREALDVSLATSTVRARADEGAQAIDDCAEDDDGVSLARRAHVLDRDADIHVEEASPADVPSPAADGKDDASDVPVALASAALASEALASAAVASADTARAEHAAPVVKDDPEAVSPSRRDAMVPSVSPTTERRAPLGELLARADRAPFVRVTPWPSRVDESPSPLGVTSGTPTIVDATLYGITNRISAAIVDIDVADDPGRISAMSVELPPAELGDPNHEDVLDAEVDVVFSGAPPQVVNERDATHSVEHGGTAQLPAEPPAEAAVPLATVAARPGGEEVGAAPAHKKTDIEQEAELAERLLAAAQLRRTEPQPGSVEALLDSFGSSEETDAVTEAAASLKRMMSLDVTPPPVKVDAKDQKMKRTPSEYDDMHMDAVPSVSPPPVDVADHDDHPLGRLTPTTMTSDTPRLAQRALFVGTTALLAGVFMLGFLYWQHPHVLGLDRDSSQGLAIGGATQADAGHCYADLTLKDLPSPHEVLLQLGQAPFASRELPTGVRLELVGLASGHQPKRVVVPSDAAWVASDEGPQTLSLDFTLDVGETNSWPSAPAGEVGGMGPKGILHISAMPENTEVWLVAGAGDGDRAVVTVPCETTAHILVLNPEEPARRRRLSVEPTMLEAARRAGGAELSVTP